MKRFVLTLMMVAVSVGLSRAESEKKAAPAAKPSPTAEKAAPTAEKPADVPPIELKNKSSFQMDAAARDPFWPIGFKPAPKIGDAAEHAAGPDIPVTAFVVSSITIERGTKFAIVNGKIMQEGQEFGLQLGTQTYHVTLKSIEDGRIVISRRGQEVSVPLRRK